jgi:NAD/NADP transhydrogenase alpha subunit
VVVMSTIFAMSAAAFLGFIVNAFKKNNWLGFLVYKYMWMPTKKKIG